MSIAARPTLKKALKAIALADSDLTTAIGDRFYSIRAPQDDRTPRDEHGNLPTDQPYVTFLKLGVERVDASGGPVKATAVYRFNCWARVPLDAEYLSLIVRDALRKYIKGTVEGVLIDLIRDSNEFDQTAMDTDNSRMVCVCVDLQIKYTEPA
jgi:hypothetical protein